MFFLYFIVIIIHFYLAVLKLIKVICDTFLLLYYNIFSNSRLRNIDQVL